MKRAAMAAALLVAQTAGPGSALAQSASAPHHSIELRLDPASGALQVYDAIEVAPRDALRFRLADWLDIEGALADGQPVLPRRDGDLWHVALPDRPFSTLELSLKGQVPATGDDWRTGALSGPDGSFLSGQAGWIPDSGEAFVTYRLTVEVPAPQIAVATGRLAEESSGEATYRAVFTADQPSELPSVFIGPYRVQEKRIDGLRLRSYFHAELAALAEDYLNAAADYLRRYSERIGPYPYADFHIVSAPLPVGLGFPNLTYVGRRVLPLPFMRGRSLAHEVLHNWWGNGVAVDYAGGNWAEGLTTYMADYALAGDAGADAAREMRLAWLRDYAALPAERDLPVTAFTSKAHEAAQVVGYNKVAFIFHMLRHELGEAAFSEALRAFWREMRFRVAGWPDLQRAFEVAAGRDLSWFFQQWIARPGAPRLSLGAVTVSKTSAGHRLSVTIRQAAPAYRVTLPLAIETSAGVHAETIALDGPETTATLLSEALPSALALDPDFEVFRRLLPGESPPILRDVTLSPQTRTIIADKDDDFRSAALALAGRLLDTPMRLSDAGPEASPEAPLLIIGSPDGVEPLLARAGAATAPRPSDDGATALAWVAGRGAAPPLLVIVARDAEALQALLRPLPHYGSRSFVRFQGGKAIETGLWPSAGGPESRRQLN